MTDERDIISPTRRTKLRRLPERGSFDRETICDILDEGFVRRVGFMADGRPFAIPTTYVRVGDRPFIHGQAASPMLRAPAWEVEACVTGTLVDGLVFERLALNHLTNYR